MPLRRVLGVLVGVGLFLTLVAIQRAEAPRASAVTRTAPDPAAEPMAASDGVQSARAPSGPLVVSTHAARLSVRSRVGGAIRSVPARNPWEQPLSFPVVGRRTDRAGGQWLKVLLGVRPNGVAGWVRVDRVDVARATDRIVVDVSGRTLRRWHRGRLTQEFSVAVGSASTPTPPGRFFVWARLDAWASGPYGTFVLGLSGYPPAGARATGDARLAIHGTDDPGDLGRAISHGCVRVLNDQLRHLRDVPMGTRVTIRA